MSRRRIWRRKEEEGIEGLEGQMKWIHEQAAGYLGI